MSYKEKLLVAAVYVISRFKIGLDEAEIVPDHLSNVFETSTNEECVAVLEAILLILHTIRVQGIIQHINTISIIEELQETENYQPDSVIQAVIESELQEFQRAERTRRSAMTDVIADIRSQ